MLSAPCPRTIPVNLAPWTRYFSGGKSANILTIASFFCYHPALILGSTLATQAVCGTRARKASDQFACCNEKPARAADSLGFGTTRFGEAPPDPDCWVMTGRIRLNSEAVTGVAHRV